MKIGNFFQLTEDDLNLHQNSVGRKVVSVDLKTLITQILCRNCKLAVILEDGLFDFEECNKMSSEIKFLKMKDLI